MPLQKRDLRREDTVNGLEESLDEDPSPPTCCRMSTIRRIFSIFIFSIFIFSMNLSTPE